MPYRVEVPEPLTIRPRLAPPAPWWLKALSLPGAMILLLSLRVRDSVWFIGDTMALLFVMATIAAAAAGALFVLNTLWAFIKMASQ